MGNNGRMEGRGFGGQEIGSGESTKSGNIKERMIILLSSTAIKDKIIQFWGKNSKFNFNQFRFPKF